MDYKNMTDDELVHLYYDESEPITRMFIAENIKNENLRRLLYKKARWLRFYEDELWDEKV